MSAWHITLKDLKLLTQDKRALVLLLVLPLMFIAIVGMSTGQFLTRDDNAERFKIVVVDQNESETSISFVSELQQRPELLITSAASMDAAFDSVRSSDATLIMIIGPKFEERVEDVRISDIFNTREGLSAGGPASLDLSFDTKPSSAGLSKLIEAVLFSQVIRFVAPIAAQKNPVTRAWLRSKDEDESETQLPTSPTKKAGSKQNAVYLWARHPGLQ